MPIVGGIAARSRPMSAAAGAAPGRRAHRVEQVRAVDQDAVGAHERIGRGSAGSRRARVAGYAPRRMSLLLLVDLDGVVYAARIPSPASPRSSPIARRGATTSCT